MNWRREQDTSPKTSGECQGEYKATHPKTPLCLGRSGGQASNKWIHSTPLRSFPFNCSMPSSHSTKRARLLSRLTFFSILTFFPPIHPSITFALPYIVDCIVWYQGQTWSDCRGLEDTTAPVELRLGLQVLLKIALQKGFSRSIRPSLRHHPNDHHLLFLPFRRR
jgi:hypothetical protein